MNRKQRRAKKRAVKKTSLKTNFDKKLGLFDLIPEDCMICSATFDKANKEMVSTWRVVVREEEKKVRIYCPTCWSKAQSLLNELGVVEDEEQKG